MKRIIHAGILCTTVLLLLSNGANAQKVASYASKWRPGIETGNEESLVNQMQFNEKSQFLFLVSNDDKNLFIDLMVADRSTVQKIMKYGLTTWFNADAKTKKTMGIEFPVTSEGADETSYKRGPGGDRKEMRMAMMASKNEEMALTGFNNQKERKSIDPRVDPDFDGKIEMLEGGKLFISLVLPLEKIGRSGVETMNNPVSIGFETGYMDLTRQGGMSSAGGQSSGGGMPGGGGMHGGGGPPPGGGTGTMPGSSDQQPRPDISEMASPSKLWIKEVVLTKKP